MRAERKSRWLRCALVVLASILVQALAAAEVCPSASEIDQVPFFVRQMYADVLDRAPDAAGQKNWTSQIEYENTRTCRSQNPALLAGNCEWNSAARIALAVLDSPESASKNGSANSNSAFVNLLFHALLRRDPQNSGLQMYLSSLNSGGDRQKVVSSFLTGDEYRRRFACSSVAPSRAAAVSNFSPAAGTGFPFELGITGHPLTQAAYSDSGGIDFDTQLKAVHDAGAVWYRVDIVARSTGDDFAKMDSLVSKAQAHGVKLLVVLVPLVDREHDSPQVLYQKSYDGAVNIVRRYKNAVHDWELFNEQDTYCMHRKGDPGWPDGTPGGDRPTDYNPQKYAIVLSILRGLSDGVHAADGSASRVINFAGWLHTGFIEKLEADRVAYEIVGIHWYSDFGDITCPAQNLPCPGRPKWFNVVKRVQSITGNKPIWMTEMNYRPSPLDNEGMDNYLSRILQTYASSPRVYPFQTVMIYELLDEPNLNKGPRDSQMGLLEVTRGGDGKFVIEQQKPAYRTLQNQRR